MKVEKKQKLAKKWFIKLQNIICKNVEQLEKEYGSNITFKKNKWKHGEFRIIKGEVIEKGGVAFSNVVGKFSKQFAKKIPGTSANTIFGLQVFLLYFTQKILKFLQCTLILGLFVQKKAGLAAAWM